MSLSVTGPLKLAALRLVSCASFIILGAYGTALGQAVPQVTKAVDPNVVTPLRGSLHPLVRNGARDLGAVPDDTPTGTLTLVMQRPAAQELLLQQFLREAHRQGSPNYHKWLTPSQFGQQFGVADTDLSSVQSWLQSEGLKIEKVSPGKNTIQFSGTASQVGKAFHTSLHAYSLNGVIHHANASELQVPSGLSPVIAAIGPMNDFRPRSLAHLLGSAQFDPATHRLNPQFTLSVPDFNLGLAPEDLVTQYDIAPLYRQGVNGAGQTIGIINETNIDLNLVAAYRKLFKLDADSSKPNLPQVVIAGNDPGVNGASIEAYLDVEVSGAIAPQAKILLYTAAGNDYSDGLTLAIIRAVEDDKASVLSLSFGNCEAFNGSSNAFYNSEWEQAAAQGQTVMVSSGDGDSAGCDAAGSQFAEFGRQVNALASTPWNISVGGTDFYYPGGLSSVFNFWSQTNDGKNGSLLQSLPEQPWNNSIYGKNLGNANQVTGGGGGQSACVIPGAGTDPLTGIVIVNGTTSQTVECSQFTGYPKPSWQSGPGVPADGVRDVPDISLFAANGENGSAYVTCEEPGDCTSDALGSTQLQVTEIGGTSAAAPAFAGVMALVNQRYGPQGQAAAVLYPLAQRIPSVFHDITVGSNNAPCSLSEPFSIECSEDASGGTFSIGGFSATPGYDMASGLGTVDVTQLVDNWDKVTFEGSRTNLFASTTRLIHGDTVTLDTSVTGERGGLRPTGNVALVTNLPQYASRGFGIIPLNAAGDGSVTTSTLPGGNYTLTAQYSGDSTYTGSESTPLNLTILPEPSVIRPTIHALAITYPGGTLTTTDLGPIKNGAVYPYGTAFFVDLKVTGAREAASVVGTPATGSTTIFDHGVAISSNSLDVTGSSSYQNIALPPGNHSFQYVYSGDSSYLPTTRSSEKAVNFSIVQAPSMITTGQTAPVTVNVGGTIFYQVLVSGVGGGLPPTGQVTFTLGNLPPQVVDLRAQIGGSFEAGSGVSYAATFFTNLPAGNYTVKATYPGDQNWGPSALTGENVTVTGSSSELPSTTKLTLNTSAGSGPIDPSTAMTLTVSVSGGKGATAPPTGLFVLVDEDTVIKLGVLTPSSSGATSTATMTFRADQLFGGTNQLIGLYSGDSNYQLSWSPMLNYTLTNNDFTLTTTTPDVSAYRGGGALGLVEMQALGQFTGPVSLSCTVTGGPTGNSVMPTCNVPKVAFVRNSRPTTSLVRIDTAESLIEDKRRNGGRFRETVPPGSYTAVISATTPGGSTHDVQMTIVVQ